jgi:hypothetical protein
MSLWWCVLLRDFGPYVIIWYTICVCCYNSFLGNAVKGFWSICNNTRLFIIPWQITKDRYTWMAQRMVICDIPIERETLHVCLYMPRVISYVGGRQGCRLSENGDASREGILHAWVCPNTVDRDGAAAFSNEVRKGPSGEEQHKAMIWKIPTWQVPVYCKNRPWDAAAGMGWIGL